VPFGFRTRPIVNRLTRILPLYIAWQFAIALLGFVAGICGLILLFDTIELLRRTAGREELGFGTVFGLALLKLPHTAETTLPFIVMLAMMFALFRLSRSHELMVIRAAGMSVWQFLAAPLAMAFVLGVANLLVIEPFAATLYDSYQRLEDALIRRNASSLDMGRSGLWMREAQGATATIIHGASVRQDDGVLELTGVSVFQLDHEKPALRFEAKQGELRAGALKLDDGWKIDTTGATVAAHFDDYSLPTSLTVDQVQDSFAAPETMSFWDLPAFIRASRDAGFSALPHRLYWQSLLASPFLLCAMILVAAGFYLTLNTRLMAWTMRGLFGIMTGFLLYFFDHFTYALGLSATLPLALAAWAPTVVTTMFGLAYLFHREDG
jgi:lipopolysaccharide export system permease protein